MKYTYYGYIIAPDRDEAENIFKAPQKTASTKLNNALIQKSAQQYNMVISNFYNKQIARKFPWVRELIGLRSIRSDIYACD